MNVLFRTDASVDIGTGHLMRCLTLAHRLRSRGSDVSFVCRDLPGGAIDLVNSFGFRSVVLISSGQNDEIQSVDADLTIKSACSLFSGCVDWIVVDHYGLDVQWERSLRAFARRIMVVDDLANRSHDCDLLLDQNYYPDSDLRYNALVPDHCVKLLGPSHVLLRPEFLEARLRTRKRDGNIRRILVFFGGSDSTNLTKCVLEGFLLLDRTDIQIDVVVGSANPNRYAIQEICRFVPNFIYHCQVTNMAELIANADLGIGAGGSAMWERCYLGLPTITVVMADNQERTTASVAALGAIEYLGWSDKLTAKDFTICVEHLLSNPQRVREIGNAALCIVAPSDESIDVVMERLIHDPHGHAMKARAHLT